MPLRPDIVDALQGAGISVDVDAPLHKRTWWRAGGAADGLVEVPTRDALVTVQRLASTHAVPVFVLGNASNLLIADGGIEGLVLKLTDELARIAPDEGQPPVLTLGGGARLVTLVGRMQRHGWTGLELFAGIPGTVGGAIRMNAGTALGETSDHLLDVEVVHPDGRVEVLPAADLHMGYRSSTLPPGAVVSSARFQTTGADPEHSRASIAEHLAYRARTQPVDVPTCGSTFRNPPGDTAGRLIDTAGLKGHRIGGAEVSTKHANFLVNTGSATAADLRALVEHVQRVVQQTHGVRLVPEVHFVGRW